MAVLTGDCEDMFTGTHRVNVFQTVNRRQGNRGRQNTGEERLSGKANHDCS